MADDEGQHILGGKTSTGAPGEDPALYHDKTATPTTKKLQLAFVVVTGLMVLVSIILSIYRGAVITQNGGLYFMLGISLVGFVVIEAFMMVFIRKGDLPQGKMWFVYFVGGCIFLESIFTDILLFQ
ncbi:uncharacterized protein LOC141903662 [Tubulanus polymorphus]|uniref:uncharacterized protein LOC141903662 n=1 Tax=Tubulanus polymorphus TaxID=672921 RepID=UPI003DA34B09